MDQLNPSIEIAKSKKEKGLVRLFQRVHAVQPMMNCLILALDVLMYLSSTFLFARTTAHKENDTFTDKVLQITLYDCNIKYKSQSGISSSATSLKNN